MSRRLQPLDGDLRIIDDARLAPLEDSSPPSPLSLDPPRLSNPGTSNLAQRTPFATSSMPALVPPSSSKPSFFRRIIKAFVPLNKSNSRSQPREPLVQQNVHQKPPLSQSPILSPPPKPRQPRTKYISMSAPGAAPIPIDQIHLAPSRAQREANAVRVNQWLEATSPIAETFDPNLSTVKDDNGVGAADVTVASLDDLDTVSLTMERPVKSFGSIGEDDAPLPPAPVFGSPLSSDTPSNDTHPSPTPKFSFTQEIDAPPPPLPVASAGGDDLPPLPASPTIPTQMKEASRASAFNLLVGGSKPSSSKRASAFASLSPSDKQDRKSALPSPKPTPSGKHQSFAAPAAPKRASLFDLSHIGGGGRSPSMPPPPKKAPTSFEGNVNKRQSVMPTMHTNATISAQMNGITDEESKRLTEAAFLF